MKRLLLSLTGAILVMFLAGWIFFSVADSKKLQWVASICYWVVMWPSLVFDRVFPPQYLDDFSRSSTTTIESGLATLLFDVVLYSLLIYGILWYHRRRTMRERPDSPSQPQVNSR